MTDISLKHQLKKWIIGISNNCKNCKKGRLSPKSIGIIIRSFHMFAPIYFITVILFVSQIWCNIIVVFLLFVVILFYTFEFCILTLIENQLCNDNFTILDPHLELLNLEINNNNRFYITTINGIIYLLIICCIYYNRFYNKLTK